MDQTSKSKSQEPDPPIGHPSSLRFVSDRCPTSSSHPDREEPPPPASTVVAMEARDWAAVPRDILLDVFFKLGPREVLLGAEFMCMAWQCATLDEHTLWRRVGMEPFHWPWRYVGEVAEAATRFAAVDHAAGQCEAFKGNCDDEELMYLVQRAPCLKSLDVCHTYDERSAKVLVEALRKFTVLEDLLIQFRYHIDGDDNLLGSVCQACPQLK
ncbi:unnamed protein product [Urochloa decumbens]|uniref:F-box domain-containing protein n=1 Tax=Urochloa decumbens TaxID=240449 RepID=A0ABC9BCR5_9POAL